jgi:hypothetical protein
MDTSLQIEFHNPNFFVSDNTISSFIKLLKKNDNTIKEFSTRGSGNGFRIIYINTLLPISQVKELIHIFIQKYEFLNIQVINKTKPLMSKKPQQLIEQLESLSGKKVTLTEKVNGEKVSIAFEKILETIRIEARKLNFEDGYALHEKLKTWTNKLI